MAQIYVVNDPQLEKPKIITNLREPGPDEVAEDTESDAYGHSQQTKVFGILCPLISLNGVAVDFGDVVNFELDATSTIPTVKFAIHDRDGQIASYLDPGNDNEMIVQIIPHFDNTYKKVNLVMLVDDVKMNGGIISGTAQYKLSKLTESRFKALGQLTTYDLFNQISIDTGLGFASNAEATEDQRFIQCSYESYKEVLQREINKSGSSADHVYDWWIDLWDNLTLCDIYDRVNNEDSEDDMKIWVVMGDDGMMTTDAHCEEVMPVFTNHPVSNKSNFEVVDFDIDNDPTTPSSGNMRAITVYEENKKEYIDHIVADGDIQKNEFVKFEYMGEVYGDYNYFLAEECRNMFMRKLMSEIVVIHLNQPQLGIMRGSQLRFVWYDNDSKKLLNREHLEETGALAPLQEQAKEFGWLKDWVTEPDADMPMLLNLQYSGQYTCIGQFIKYSSDTQQWDCWLYLVRPASKRPNLLDLDDKNTSETNGN